MSSGLQRYHSLKNNENRISSEFPSYQRLSLQNNELKSNEQPFIQISNEGENSAEIRTSSAHMDCSRAFIAETPVVLLYVASTSENLTNDGKA